MNTVTAFAAQAPHRQTFRRSRLRALAKDQRGMSTVEYIILLVVVVVGCVGTWNKIGAKITADLEEAEKNIQKLEKD